MPLFDTSNTIDSSIYLKAKLKSNMVGDNYYIENTQAKRNRDWEFRYNRVDIEEELNRQYFYTNEDAKYTPIDVVINNVKDERGEDLGTDWAKVSFKNLRHKSEIGSRYRFSVIDGDYGSINTMSEEEKHFNKSIWLCINRSPITGGNSSILRRCNSSIAFLGSENYSNKNISETHYEPCIIDTEMKFVQIYNNKTLSVPQAEFYATMQCNYFTNSVKTNDRFILGTTDLNVRENNYAYKVKAIVKSASSKTFVKDSQDLLESTNLIVLALDRDMISPDDNIETRVASCAPIYKVDVSKPVGNFYIEMEEGSETRILQGDEQTYIVHLKKDGEIIDDLSIHFNYSYDLVGIKEERQSVYYTFVNEDGSNIFKVKNKKQCKSGKLNIGVSCSTPGHGVAPYAQGHEGDDTKLISQVFIMELGGFY